MKIDLNVNGKAASVDVPADMPLLWVLRDVLKLSGTKFGCGEGQCGACTVLIDGAPARSCLTLAAQAEGMSIRTVEGLADGDKLHPIQRAFKRHHALQCGFCTPGFLTAAVALLDEMPDPTEAQVREYLNGNICRCTGYQFIVDAVLSAAKEMRDAKGGA